MKPIDSFQIIFIATVIHVACCAPASDFSILEYGPGYNTFGHQQMKAAKQRGIQPIVDTIGEKEKYGNDGGNIRAVSKAIIRVSEGTSASVSKVLGAPNENTINLLKPLEPFLVDLGSRLGGIA